MNEEQFNSLYETRLDGLSPYLKSIRDDDDRQEAYIGIYEALKSDHDATDRYLLNRAKWNQSKARKRGRSVDNGFYKRDEIGLIQYEQMIFYDQIFSQISPVNRNTPLDEVVSDKISLENLLDDLTSSELEVLEYKVMDEMKEKDVMRKLRIGAWKYNEIKTEIRRKIDQAFN